MYAIVDSCKLQAKVHMDRRAYAVFGEMHSCSISQNVNLQARNTTSGQ